MGEEYLATWCYSDGSKGSQMFIDPMLAKETLRRRISLMGGLACLTRMSDFKEVFRIIDFLVSECQNVAA